MTSKYNITNDILKTALETGSKAWVNTLLESIGTAEWLKGLIVNGIVGGVGAVLGFVPQMFVLFLFLAFLEACGYMSRIAFVMDKIFRKFGGDYQNYIRTRDGYRLKFTGQI